MLAISLEQVLAIGRPSWREIAYAMDFGLLEPDVPSRLANHFRDGSEPLDSPIWELADQGPDAPARALVAKLAAAEPPVPEARLRTRWYALSLLQLAELAPADPLPLIEEIYCEFDHPSELAQFIPYMPAAEPEAVARRTREENLWAMRTAWAAWARDRRPLWIQLLQEPEV